MAVKKITEQVTFRSRPSLRSMQTLAEEGKDIPELRLLFGDFIAENCLVHFPSPRGVGKSWLCMQLCIAIAGGWDSFLGEPVSLFGNTLYINNELGEKVMRKRASRLMHNLPQPVQHEHKAMVYTTRQNLWDDLPNIIQIIEKIKPVLIVIDNLRMAFADIDTNSNKEITRLMFTLLALCEGTKTAIVITDHFRKHTAGLLSDSDLQTGSGVKTDLVDGDFFLRHSFQHKRYRLLKRGKSRHFEDAEGAKLLQLNPDTMWFELIAEQVNEAEHIGIQYIKDKEEQKDFAKALHRSGKSYAEIAAILGKGKGTIHRWLHAGEDEKSSC